MILLALVLVLALQSFRTLFPLLFAFGEDVDYFLAAGIGVASFAAPILAWPIHRLLGPRLAASVAVSALVVLRLLLQFLHPIPLWLSIASTAAGLVALVLLAAAFGRSGPAGGRRSVLGILVGLALDTAIRGAFLTLDLPWQEGPVAVTVSVFLAAATLGAAWTKLPRDQTGASASGGGVGGMAALGVFLVLQMLFLQSPAFVASSAGYSLEGGLTVVLVADAAAFAAVWSPGIRTVPVAAGLGAGVLLGAIAYGFTQIVGPVIALLVVLGQVLGTGLLTLALDRPAPRGDPAVWRVAVGGAAGGVGLALLLAGYQLHYEIPLPFANTLLPPVAGLLLGAAAFRRPEPQPSPGPGVLRLAAVPTVLLLVPLTLLLFRPDRPVTAVPVPSVRIVNYNIHQGLNPDGQVDPEATARTIEALDPDVLLLQEIGRGWPIHTFMDTGEWLSRRLGMPFLYQPAADPQFGNAIMTRLPILEHDGGFLPFGEGPQRRSYLRARIDLGGGRRITVIDVHLQHQERTKTREAQIRELLRVWDGQRPAVIGGDMNTQPDEANLRLFLDTGLVSVQDEAGLGHLPTATEEAVRGDRVDYVFVTQDVSFRDVVVPYSFASDHLPIAVTVAIG